MILDLPTVNAVLNSLSTLCLCAGYFAIRRGRRGVHAALMISALGASILFLVSYVVHFATHGTTRYLRDDWTRPVYLAILLSHTVLAAANVPLVIATVLRAARRRFPAHRRIARRTLPVWLYVNVTGVLVYLMLYRLG